MTPGAFKPRFTMSTQPREHKTRAHYVIAMQHMPSVHGQGKAISNLGPCGRPILD